MLWDILWLRILYLPVNSQKELSIVASNHGIFVSQFHLAQMRKW